MTTEVASAPPSTTTETSKCMLNVNVDVLSDVERRSFATNILHCFAGVRNRWSTDEELAHLYSKFRPGTQRSPLVNVRENKQSWNRKIKELNGGHTHEESDDEKADGCVFTDPHRVCKRMIKVDDVEKEQSRVHPTFAEEIFSEGTKTIDEITAVPIRNFKRKRVEELPLNSEDEEMTKRLKMQTTAQKRLLSKLKRKLTEAQKIREEWMENEKIFMEIKEEVHRKDQEFRRKIKGKVPVSSRAQSEGIEEDDGEETKKRSKESKGTSSKSSKSKKQEKAQKFETSEEDIFTDSEEGRNEEEEEGSVTSEEVGFGLMEEDDE